jgi:hypothetical protein
MADSQHSVPYLGCGLTEEVVKNSKGEYWAINGARKYEKSEVEKSGPFYFVKEGDNKEHV